jgi:hypothetical protein
VRGNLEIKNNFVALGLAEGAILLGRREAKKCIIWAVISSLLVVMCFA